MDYKAEVMVDKKVVHSQVYKDYSHPNQVVKLVVKKMKNTFDYFHVFVLNALGELWNYGVEKTAKGYRATVFGHDFRGRQDVLAVFSGNVLIVELSGDAI